MLNFILFYLFIFFFFHAAASKMPSYVLCAGCHGKFDMMNDPGWSFYPADLDFFQKIREPRLRETQRESIAGNKKAAGRIQPLAKAEWPQLAVFTVVFTRIFLQTFSLRISHGP